MSNFGVNHFNSNIILYIYANKHSKYVFVFNYFTDEVVCTKIAHNVIEYLIFDQIMLFYYLPMYFEIHDINFNHYLYKELSLNTFLKHD